MAELEELKEAHAATQARVAELEKENARLKEAEIARRTKDKVTALLSEAEIPEATRTRLAGELSTHAPMKDGDLDEAQLAEKVATRIKEETDYIAKISGGDPVRGMGGDTSTDDLAASHAKKLEESFRAMGLSESAAKAAAGGR